MKAIVEIECADCGKVIHDELYDSTCFQSTIDLHVILVKHYAETKHEEKR